MARLPIADDLGFAVPQDRSQVVTPDMPQEFGAQSRLLETSQSIVAGLQEKSDRMEMNKASLHFQKGMIEANSIFDNPQNSLEEIEKKYNETIDKYRNESLGMIGNASLQDALKFKLDESILKARASGTVKLADVAQNRGIAEMNNILESSREMALTGSFDESVDAANDAIETARLNGWIDDVQSQNLKSSMAEDYSIAKVGIMEPQDRLKVLREPKGTAAEFIPTDKRINMLRSTERELASAKNELKYDVASRTKDAEAAYMSGMEFDNSPSRDEYIAAYGVRDGEKRYASLNKVKRLGSQISAAAMMPPQDQAEMLKKSDPRNKEAGHGFAEDMNNFKVLASSLASLNKEKFNDPVSYIHRRDNELLKQWEEAKDNPAALKEYATSIKAEQERLGVASPRLLPNGYASQIVSQFSNIQEGGETASQLIENLSNQWGDEWPTVYRQLSKELPSAALVIGSGVDKATAERLARLAPLPTKEITKSLSHDDIKSSQEKIASSMEEFRQTLSQQVGGVHTFSVVYEQANRLAASYISEGLSPGDAAEKAYQSLVGSKYSFNDTYRIPQNFDDGLIERGADYAIQSLSAGNIAVNAPKGLPSDFVTEFVTDSIKRDAYFVTLPDESGLALYHNGSALIDGEGQPITFSFDELSTMGINNQLSPSDKITAKGL